MYIVLSEKKMFKISVFDNMKSPIFPKFTNKIKKKIQFLKFFFLGKRTLMLT